MRMNGIMQKILLEMFQKTKISIIRFIKIDKKKPLAAFLIFVILILSLGMTQGTLGRFSKSFVSTDSANAANFDVIITPPKEFWTEQSNSVFEYHFLSDTDIQRLIFQITNNGETSILCKPYINGNITYRVYVEGEVCTEFHVKANETIDFWLVITPDGLDTTIKNANLFIDIQQMEGG